MYEIMHYGIKGMHWGVTSADAKSLGKLATKAASNRSDKTTTVFGKKVKDAGGLHSVTDSDLKSMLDRLGAEKRFTDFMNEEKKKRAEGRKAVIQILIKVGAIATPLIAGAFAARTAAPTVFRTVSQFQKSLGS